MLIMSILTRIIVVWLISIILSACCWRVVTSLGIAISAFMIANMALTWKRNITAWRETIAVFIWIETIAVYLLAIAAFNIIWALSAFIEMETISVCLMDSYYSHLCNFGHHGKGNHYGLRKSYWSHQILCHCGLDHEQYFSPGWCHSCSWLWSVPLPIPWFYF